jgi:N-acetyl-alpha-D-muramate 1-phosphate uridylyltransferase
MVLIEGKPFLEHQIELLKRHELRDLLLCVGYLGEKIESYFGNGNKFGTRIRYSWENAPLGTGGALKNAEALLGDEFMLLYGDSYVPIDFNTLIRAFRGFNMSGTMLVYKNNDRYDKSNIVLNENNVSLYNKNIKHSEMYFIDAGISIYRKKALEILPPGKTDLGVMIEGLVKEQQLAGFETDQRFYEIGSLQGLQDFEIYLKERH